MGARGVFAIWRVPGKEAEPPPAAAAKALTAARDTRAHLPASAAQLYNLSITQLVTIHSAGPATHAGEHVTPITKDTPHETGFDHDKVLLRRQHDAGVPEYCKLD
ncbi:hypothetical protein MATL_G00146530 [Megalops atlanticus]|uniref:Uncharacterized protein n=1 Tax=Megalops atlanticus TaxID=7932 RepID=A0A9D3PTP1_MEGAT|nr:hypothetical protein MATL_G00146530 [Megalops atlanticus]